MSQNVMADQVVKQSHRSPSHVSHRIDTPIQDLSVSAYVIPTDGPESDGTLEWQHTLLVLVEVEGGGRSGLGYTYGSYGSAAIVKELLTDVVVGHDALSVEECW